MNQTCPPTKIIHHDPKVVRQHTNAFMPEEVALTTEAEKVITVEVTDTHGCVLDAVRVEQGQIVKISIKQWRALSRHFRFIDGPAEHAPAGWVPPVKPAAQ
ncbi:MAG TPA: hypothetical protein VGO67_03830 [Verrucomicrobiae bacterium]